MKFVVIGQESTEMRARIAAALVNMGHEEPQIVFVDRVQSEPVSRIDEAVRAITVTSSTFVEQVDDSLFKPRLQAWKSPYWEPKRRR